MPNTWFVCDKQRRFIVEATPKRFFVRDFTDTDSVNKKENNFCAHANQFSEDAELIKVDLHKVLSSP